MKNNRVVHPVYRAIFAALELRRRELGLAMWELDDKAGTADRSFAKLLHADAPSGRRAQWSTLQGLIDALYRHGYRITIEPADEKLLDADIMAQTPQASNSRTTSYRGASGMIRAIISSAIAWLVGVGAEARALDAQPIDGDTFPPLIHLDRQSKVEPANKFSDLCRISCLMQLVRAKSEFIGEAANDYRGDGVPLRQAASNVLFIVGLDCSVNYFLAQVHDFREGKLLIWKDRVTNATISWPHTFLTLLALFAKDVPLLSDKDVSLGEHTRIAVYVNCWRSAGVLDRELERKVHSSSRINEKIIFWLDLVDRQPWPLSRHESFVKREIGFYQDQSTAERPQKKQRGPRDQPSGESVDRIWLTKPPALLIAPGVLSTLTGFVLLFGPHRRPNSTLHNEVGVILYFAGMAAFALGRS